MTAPRHPIPLFQLPEWAKWWGWIDLNSELKIQLTALKYPTWEASFYPVFLGKENKALFSFPKTIDETSRDGRRWWCCPDNISFSPKTLQIAVDHYLEEDYPRPYVAERQIASPPNYLAVTTDSIRVVSEIYTNVLSNLPKLSEDFEDRKIILFDANTADGKAAVTWPTI